MPRILLSIIRIYFRIISTKELRAISTRELRAPTLYTSIDLGTMADSAQCVAVARLCTNCEPAMVDDFDKEFQMRADHKSGKKRAIPRNGGDAPTEFFLTDNLPYLSRLRGSAQQGCDFCGFLRTLILLDETRDRLRSEYKTDIASLGPVEIEIAVIYNWNQKDVNDHYVNNYLVVNVDFGYDIRCDFWNSLNAVDGIVNPNNFVN